MPMKGQALKIISQNEETKNFELDHRALASVLLRDDVRDKPVCVVAVAGAFRKGKSFLLNYFLRYCASQRKENWMGSSSDPLKGFSWVKNSQRETTGILIWSEPFIVKLRSGEEIAILLMDTQGTFDTESSLEDSTVVFALTVLVSSVVVYNLMGQIQEDDLMHLEAFTQYGLLARGGSDEATAFQKIVFLIRDWINTENFAHGAQGGVQYLETILKVKEDQDPAHQDLRRNLRKCFSDIGSYLMPEPGKAAKIKDFDGRYSELDDEFVKHLKKLVPLLLAPENIEKKTLAGQTIKAEDLFNNFKIYMDAFNSKDLPAPVSVADSMKKARCAVAAKEAKERYDNGMKKSVDNDSVLGEENLKALHSSLHQSALEYYRSRCCGINERISSIYEQQLTEELASLHLHFVEINTKNAEIKAAKADAESKERCAVATKEAKERYDNGMKKSVNNDSVLGKKDLEALHSSLHQSALKYYRSRCCGINERISSIYEQQLTEDLTSCKAKFVEANTKNAELQKYRKEMVSTKSNLEKSETTKKNYKRFFFGVTAAAATAVGATVGAVVALPAAATVGIAAGAGGITLALQSFVHHLISRKSKSIT